MLELYLISDFVLNDYGGSVLTSLYLKKKFALLDLGISQEFKSEYLQRLKATKALDYEIRKNLNKKMIIKNEDQFFIEKIEYLLRSNYDTKLKKLRAKYFGILEKKVSLKELVKKLQNILNV